MKSLILLCLTILVSGCVSFKPELLDYSSVKVSGNNSTETYLMDYGVYTPPGWILGEKLPIILFLHGGGGSHQSLERYGVANYLDQKITAGEIPRVIIVTPDGHNGFWENWHDGTFNYRDWVIDEVFTKVRNDYQTLACPQYCHLAGISMGGFGVLRIAYFQQNLFSSVSSISAPIYNDQTANEQSSSWLAKLIFPLERIFGQDNETTYRKDNPYNAWVDDEELQKMRLQLIWGEHDHKKIKAANEQFHLRLIENNIEHDSYVYAGKHKWVDWIPNFEKAINFLVNPSNQ